MKFNEYVKMLLESTLVEDAGSSLEKLQTKYSGVKKIIKIMRGNGGNGLKDVTKKELSKAFSELNKELLGGKQFNWDRQEIANDIYSEAKRSFDKPSYEFIETLCDTIYSDDKVNENLSESISQINLDFWDKPKNTKFFTTIQKLEDAYRTLEFINHPSREDKPKTTEELKIGQVLTSAKTSVKSALDQYTKYLNKIEDQRRETIEKRENQ